MPIYIRVLCLIGISLIMMNFSPVPAYAEKTKTESPSFSILAYGDSLVAGYGLRPDEDFSDQLENRLEASGLSTDVINAGVSGETTAGGLARLDWTLEGVSRQPDLVILVLGANDMLRGLPPEQVYDNLDQILDRITDKNIPVLLAGMKAPDNMGQDYVMRFNQIYPRLADKYKQVELYEFFLQDVAGVAGLNQPDGIHPNAKGVQKIVKHMAPKVKAILITADKKTTAPENNTGD